VEIVFAAAGAAALLVILIAACVCCSRKTAPRRRKRPHNPMHYYADFPSSACKGKGTHPLMNLDERGGNKSEKRLDFLGVNGHPPKWHRSHR
jgi:hypothetical protein